MSSPRRAPEAILSNRAARVLLTPLSWLYIAGLKLFLLPYGIRLRKRHKLACPVVCVGNLTFGGTGKTPAVIAIAEELVRRGLKIVILSRGHGGRLSGKGAVVSDGSRRTLDYKDCGDEPALIADSLPGVPVVVGKNRVIVGHRIIRGFSPDVVLMDDGMQYWQLHKDVTIALVNARAPFGTGGVLPAGTLREPKSGIKRASAVVVTGADGVSADELEHIRKELVRLNPEAEVFTAEHVPKALYRLGSREELPVEHLQGRRVMALSSIGSPVSFESTLKCLGADVSERLDYPDHYKYTRSDMDLICARCSETAVVTTEKDAVRLDPDRVGDVLVLSVRMKIEGIERLADLVREGCGL